MNLRFSQLFLDCTRLGKKIPKEDYLANGNFPIIDQGQTDIAGYSNSDEGIYSDVPAIIFGDHTRVVKYSDIPFFLGADGVKILKNRQNDICMKYLYYELSAASIPNTGYNRHYKWLKELNFKIPEIEVQVHISLVLDKVLNLIREKKHQVEQIDVMVKSRFVEMFGDPLLNPMEWEVKKLKDLTIEIRSGNTPKGGSQVYVESGIAFFRSQNVWRNRIEYDDIAYINETTHKAMHQTSLRNRDILITKTGRFNTDNSSLGRAALYVGDNDKANINGHVYLVRLREGQVHEFVLYIMTTDEYRDYIRKVCVGGIDKRQINKIHLEEFPIIMPPFHLQSRFANFVQKTDKLKFICGITGVSTLKVL